MKHDTYAGTLMTERNIFHTKQFKRFIESSYWLTGVSSCNISAAGLVPEGKDFRVFLGCTKCHLSTSKIAFNRRYHINLVQTLF